MPQEIAIHVQDLRHRYDVAEALRGLSLSVQKGEVFALLGPNGSGKSTFFKLLSTLIRIQSGAIQVFGCDVANQAARVRELLGVVFQSPSLDKKLRVEENLRCCAQLYGVPKPKREGRIDHELERFGLADRRRDLVESLSGGLRRRVELAQCLLHRPRVLVLDEPSTGLDPAARAELWRFLLAARDEGVTVVFTTHLLEEAERADRIAILHRGELAALDTPSALQDSVGGDTITLRGGDPEALAQGVRARFEVAATVIDDSVRIEHPSASELAPSLYQALREQIDELTIGKPTLEDVFIARTGHRFHGQEERA